MSLVQIPIDIKEKIISEIQKDAQNCGSVCKDYQIMRNVYEPKHWFARYTKGFFNEGKDHPRTVYRWICFNEEGERTECDPTFVNVSTENKFYGGMYLVEELGNVFG